MDIRQLEPDVLLVGLPGEPQLRPELALVRQNAARMEGNHVIVDFSRVEIITSVSIGELMRLQKAVSTWGGRLIFCSVRLVTKCILRTVGLELCFEFAENTARALTALQEFGEATTDTSRRGPGGPS